MTEEQAILWLNNLLHEIPFDSNENRNRREAVLIALSLLSARQAQFRNTKETYE